MSDQTSKNFDVLDDLSSAHRSFLIMLCGLTCCWGFVNNTVLLILASKIGFPLAVVACSINVDYRNICKMIYYTILIVLLGWIYFYLFNVEIDSNITKNFVPSATDFVLAVGLGGALKVFWNHKLRMNIIIMSAGLASLLPACIMIGYFIANSNISGIVNSCALYLQYVLGITIGSKIFPEFIERR
jgi:hypothetical protein